MKPSNLRTSHLTAALALTFLLVPTSGCDTSVQVGLDASFFVGSWHLESVRDQSGDRTGDVQQVVESLNATFTANNTFQLHIVYAAATGQPSQTFSGTYSVTGTGQLVLTTPEVSAIFDATAQGENKVELRAPAALVQAIIAGSAADIGLVGTVVLTLARGAG
jgi:hypothetical protein